MAIHCVNELPTGCRGPSPRWPLQNRPYVATEGKAFSTCILVLRFINACNVYGEITRANRRCYKDSEWQDYPSAIIGRDRTYGPRFHHPRHAAQESSRLETARS